VQDPFIARVEPIISLERQHLQRGVRLKSVIKTFAEWRRGNWRCKTLPFYTIRKTRPPSLLGRLFIVIGLVGSIRLQILCRYMLVTDSVDDGNG
jgi:hypothetical protein